MQKSKELCPELRRNEGDTGDVAARPTETGDEPEFDRVAAGSEDDRDGCGRRLGCNCRWGVMRSDHCYLTPDQIDCEVWQSIGLGLRPAILDRHVLALGMTDCTNALPECGHKKCTISRLRHAEIPDHRHRRLLRPRRKRPRRRRAAEQRNELAPFHSITSSARASSVGGTSRFSILAVWTLMTSSNLVDCTTGRSAGLAPLRMRPT